MSIINLMKTSIYSLKSHKLRVFLTMIGIIIGISSVVTILSIGNGLKAEVNNSAQDASANKISVNFEPENAQADLSLIEPFNKADLYSLQQVDGVQKVEAGKGALSAALGITIAQASYFDQSETMYLSTYDNKTFKVKYGRYFNAEENKKRLIALREETAKKLFGDAKKAVGHGVDINGYTYEVIGVLGDNKGLSSMISFDGLASLISKDSQDDMTSKDAIANLDIYIQPNKDRNKVFEDIKKELESNHPDIKGEYTLQDPQEITKSYEKIIGSLTTFVALITGISLFVGGIGVMNIMYVSVSERKREIGIRRAIGAKPKSILLQFLFEAILVTGIGGIIGILCGYLFAKLVGAFITFKPVMTVGSFAGATITSVIVGVVFGIIPAYNASKMDPIKAIYR